MEHVGKKAILAVAQEPWEHVSDSGAVNSFATLVPLLTTDGTILDRSDFRHSGLVFWLVRQHAIRFANPGRLIAGKLEDAVNPERLQYQLAPDSAEIVQPAEAIEIVEVNNTLVREPRDLVNTDSVLTMDHVPTPLVLVHWAQDVWGPFRTELAPEQPTVGVVYINLKTSRPDQTAFRIPTSDLSSAAKFGPYYRPNLSATVSNDNRDPTWNSYTRSCAYSLLLGPGFRRLPSLGYPLVSVETDKELLLRYARRFATRKDMQRLREILQAVDPSLDPRVESATEAERLVFESIKRRSFQVDDELATLARSLVNSGLIDSDIAAAVDERTREHIREQTATLSVEIAAKIGGVRAELDTLEKKRDAITGELESKRRRDEDEVDARRAEFDVYKRSEELKLENARRDLEGQRDALGRHLQSLVERYTNSRERVVNEFLALTPLFERAGLSTATARAQTSGLPNDDVKKAATPLQLPSFVLASQAEDSVSPLSEMAFFDRFQKHVSDSAYDYRRIDLLSFHLSVKCCDITILGGLSGTGKSTLPALYAEALAGTAAQSASRYLHVAVSPAWLDMRDLVGHVNSLERQFEPSESGLYRQLIYAHSEYARKQQQTGIYLVTLDEMNLAHVEHYFSGFLQVLEQQGREIRFFDPNSVAAPSVFAPYSTLSVPKSVRFVGTVNFDETTKQLSRRLLDRANLIHLRPMEQANFFSLAADQRPAVAGPPVRMQHYREWRRSAPLDSALAPVWDRVQQSLARLGTPITPRRRQAMLEFIASCPNDLATPLEVFDLQIAQRLLPQVRGLYRPGAQEALEALRHELSQHAYGFPEAIAGIRDLQENEQIGLPMADVTEP